MAICEMCGKDTKLVLAEVDGAELNICSGCAKYGTVKRAPRNYHPQYKPGRKEEPEFKIVNNYSALIREARELKGMKREDFAKFLNEKESLVAKWEQGSLKPRLDVAKRVGKVLKIGLVEREIETKPPILKKGKSEGFTLGDFIKKRR